MGGKDSLVSGQSKFIFPRWCGDTVPNFSVERYTESSENSDKLGKVNVKSTYNDIYSCRTYGALSESKPC